MLYRVPVLCTRTLHVRVLVASSLRQWLMRCDVRAAIAQIVIEDYGNGTRYEGQVNQDGGSYVGRFHGKGVFSASNGDRYVGEFRNNGYHGHGTRTYADGRVKSGKWEKSSFRG